MDTSTYTYGDHFVREGDDNFHNTLASWYKVNAKPMCMCRPDEKGHGIECYIAKLSANKSKSGEDLYIVKKMPDSGRLHSPSCSHYQLPESLSGKVSLSDNTIQEDSESGFTKIKTSISFASKKNRLGQAVEEDNKVTRDSAQSIGLRESQLSLLGILHYLLDSTNLNRWSPKMAGKRHYGLLRFLLNQQADRTIAKSSMLSDRLFIPPVYSAERKEKNDDLMQSFIESLTPNKTESPVGIVIGQFREFGRHYNSATMSLKHVDYCFNINIGTSDVVNRLEKKNSEIFDIAEVHQFPVLVIATVINRAGILFAKRLDFQLLSREFLPIGPRDYERRLIEQLVNENRYFSVPLRFNMDKCLPLASAILEDLSEPIPIFFKTSNDSDSDEADSGSLPDLAIELTSNQRKWNLPLI